MFPESRNIGTKKTRLCISLHKLKNRRSIPAVVTLSLRLPQGAGEQRHRIHLRQISARSLAASAAAVSAPARRARRGADGDRRGQILRLTPPFPALDFGLRLPHLIVPTWEQIVHGTAYAVMPQIPLTLTNAIIVTAAVSRQLSDGAAPGQRAQPGDHHRAGKPTGGAIRRLPDVPWRRRHHRPLPFGGRPRWRPC